MSAFPWPAKVSAATIAMLATVALGCGQRPAEKAGAANDLVSLLDLATVRRQTGLVDLGTPEARPFLEHGWSWADAEDVGFVWGVGRRSTVRFFLVETRDLPISLRGAAHESPDGEPQTVRLTVNGAQVDRFELGPEAVELRATLPAASLVPGWNRLELRYRYWRPGPAIRRLAVRWDWIRFGEGDSADDTPRADTAEATLYLPYGSQLEYYLRLPRAATLEIAELTSGSDATAGLQILLEPEGADPRQLATLAAGRDLQVELGNEAPGVARLFLRAIGTVPSGGITLRQPRIEPVPAVTEARETAPRPNVIVYLIDALRADRVGTYNPAARNTPRIDEFAADALVFDDAIAQSSWTKPAIASLFTGLLPPSHGVLLREHALPPRATTLAEALLAAGYQTAGFSTNPFVSQSFGFDQGFLDFVYLDAGRPGTHHAFSDEVNDRVLAWLDEAPARPFLLYVHTIDPHAPYTPPLRDRSAGSGDPPPPSGPESPPEAPSCSEQPPLPDSARRQLIDRYDDEIAFNDDSFGRFVDELRRRGLYDDSLIILLSDHGEAFWEHRGWRHENFLYYEVIDIPLMIKLPRGTPSSAEAGLAQQVDVLPTVLDLLQLPVPAAVQGRTLLAGGRDRPPPVGFAYLQCPAGKRLDAVLAGPWKLIRTTDPKASGQGIELYHRQRDPTEQTDEAEARPEVVRRLLTLLDAQETGGQLEPPRADIGDELAETLRALGYVD